MSALWIFAIPIACLAAVAYIAAGHAHDNAVRRHAREKQRTGQRHG